MHGTVTSVRRSEWSWGRLSTTTHNARVVEEKEKKVVFEMHDGLPRLKTHPPGERPGILREPGSQRSDRTARRSSVDGVHLLAPLALADAADEALDSAALSS